ncbi:MAG: hypothetical protein R2877_04500 [Bdellovibrionota bacterium]
MTKIVAKVKKKFGTDTRTMMVAPIMNWMNSPVLSKAFTSK